MYSALDVIAIAAAIQTDVDKLGLGVHQLDLANRRQYSLPKGVDYAHFQSALIAAFTSRSAIRQMVRFVFNENLDAIADGSDLNDICFNLIDWAERSGKLQELIEGAHSYNRNNPVLSEFVGSLNLPQTQ